MTVPQGFNDLAFEKREDLQRCLDAMSDIIEQFQVVSVSDLNDLIGLESEPEDEKWGWRRIDKFEVLELENKFILHYPWHEELSRSEEESDIVHIN